jgi:hypothetical protein
MPSRQYLGRGCTAAVQPDLGGAARHGLWEGGKVEGTFPIPMATIAQPPAQMPAQMDFAALWVYGFLRFWLFIKYGTLRGRQGKLLEIPEFIPFCDTFTSFGQTKPNR